MLLAHMGADVVKIEHGKGDRFRHAWMAIDADHDGYEFLVVNTNKRGITLNLKHEKGKQLFLDLVKTADVVVENFSIGVMDRLGLSYDRLREVNPRIIYASSKGYGEDGPSAHLRANAATIMAATGWTNAGWDFAGKQGTIPQGIGDEAAGVSLAVGILAALYGREQTGVGQKIEVSMQEALLGFMVSNFHTLFERRSSPAAQAVAPTAMSRSTCPTCPSPVARPSRPRMDHPEAITIRVLRPRGARRRITSNGSARRELGRVSDTRRLAEVFRETGLSAARCRRPRRCPRRRTPAGARGVRRGRRPAPRAGHDAATVVRFSDDAPGSAFGPAGRRAQRRGLRRAAGDRREAARGAKGRGRHLDDWFRGRRARMCAGRGCRAPRTEGNSAGGTGRADGISRGDPALRKAYRRARGSWNQSIQPAVLDRRLAARRMVIDAAQAHARPVHPDRLHRDVAHARHPVGHGRVEHETVAGSRTTRLKANSTSRAP